MDVNWEAVSAGAAVITLAGGAIASVARFTRRTRLQKRMIQALQVIQALPNGEHERLRKALHDVVEEAAAQLARIEMRWVRAQRRWTGPRFTALMALLIAWTTLSVVMGLMEPETLKVLLLVQAGIGLWIIISFVVYRYHAPFEKRRPGEGLRRLLNLGIPDSSD